jgi:hypothetical protein
VIAVLASRFDPEALDLVSAWSDSKAVLLSAEDLCSPGWSFRPAAPAESTAVINGQRVRVSELRAVVTRRPAVLAEELMRITQADRNYVAAEINAFLVAWLSSLPCRVVNRPTPTSLCGPAWSELYWREAARRAGVDWTEAEDAGEAHEVMLCGRRVLFSNSIEEETAVRALGHSAGAELMGVRLRSGRVCGVSVAPPLTNREVRDCLLSYLVEGA